MENPFLKSLLSEWSAKSPTGIIDVRDLDGLQSILESRSVGQEFVSEFLQNINSSINELTIRDEAGKDHTLTLKQAFVDKLGAINPEWASKLSEGDEIIRQPSTITDGEKIKISRSSLSRVDVPGDTSWLIPNLPGVIFYIDLSIDVNSMLRRSSKKSEKLLSTDTEALHECFFVVALAAQIDSQGNTAGLNSVNTLKSLMELISSTRILIKDKEKINHVFSSRIGNEPFSSEVNLRKVDAQKCAESAYKKISEVYNSPTFDYVTRVFEGSDGKKVVADASIKVAGEILSISLKYKKGQLNNLKATTVLESLFGIDVHGKSLMDSIYEFDSEKVDQVLRYFVFGINTHLPPKNNKFFINHEGLTYPVFKKLVAKNEYYPLAYTTVSTELVKSNQSAAEFVEKYKKLKTTNLSATISRYIEVNKTSKNNFTKFLTYILRCEPETGYMYVGDSGRSIYTIPSQSTLLTKDITVNVEPKQSVDYSAHVTVFVKEELAFEFDINLRWTKSQWVGDMSQVGKNLKAYEINW